MKIKNESEQYSYTCKLCGDSYNHKKKKQSRTQCPSCKERQDWGNAATEPKWWPRFIPTKDNGRSKNIRWTNYALSSFFLVLTILIFVAIGVGGEIAEKRAKETAATSTTTTVTTIAPVTTTTTTTLETKENLLLKGYLYDVRQIGGLAAAESDEYLVKVGKLFCESLDEGMSAETLWQKTQSSSLNSGQQQIVLEIMWPAANNFCPQHLTETIELIDRLK